MGVQKCFKYSIESLILLYSGLVLKCPGAVGSALSIEFASKQASKQQCQVKQVQYPRTDQDLSEGKHTAIIHPTTKSKTVLKTANNNVSFIRP